MEVLRSLGRSLQGFGIGLLLAFVLCIPTLVIATIATNASRGQEIAEQLEYLPVIGAAIGLIAGIVMEVQRASKLAKEAEAKAQAEAEARDLKQRAEIAAAEKAKARAQAKARRREGMLQWSPQLQASSVDRLSFEYHKRQNSIQALETKIARLSRERSELRAELERWRYDDDATHYNPRAFTIEDEIDDCETDIAITQEEMATLQAILDRKWS